MWRNKQSLGFLSLLALIAAVLVWRESASGPEPSSGSSLHGQEIGGPFRLIDQRGRERRDADFRGRYMLVYFGYSSCPDVCPTTLEVMAQALNTLGKGARRVVPIFITVDPARDNPQLLLKYVQLFGPNFVGLTGTIGAIMDVEKKYRVYVARRSLASGGYAMDHSNTLYLMGPDGRLVADYPDEISPKNLAAKLRASI